MPTHHTQAPPPLPHIHQNKPLHCTTPTATQVLQAALAAGAFAINRSSVFNDDAQWRTPKHHRGGGEPPAAEGGGGGGDEASSLGGTSRCSSAFGGRQFWEALRGVEGLEAEVGGKGGGGVRGRATPFLHRAAPPGARAVGVSPPPLPGRCARCL